MTIRVRRGQHSCVLGSVGAGKSWFEKNGLLPCFPTRIIVLDSQEDDYADFPVVSVKKALRLAAGDKDFIVRVATVGAREKDEPTVEALCEGLLTRGHDLVLVIAEATDYSDASYIPPYLRALMRRARHRNINVVVSTQRPAMLSKDYYSLSVHKFWFYVDEFDVSRTEYARYLNEHISQIPYESYRCIYRDPSGHTRILAPVPKYDWGPRLKSANHG